MRFLWVGVGGAVGSMLRYGVSLLLADREFPVATLTVNVVGSFAIGFVLMFTAGRWSTTLSTALAVGLIGGFTTFSTFAWETLTLSQSGSPVRAGLYLGLSVVGGLTASALGAVVGRMVA